MQLTRRTVWTVAAVGVVCVVVAGALGVGRLDADPSLQTAVRDVDVKAVDARPYPDPHSVPVNARLLPNLRSLPPVDVAIRIADGQRQLWFTSTLANAGIGPVEVIPDGLQPCPPGQRHASQVLYHDVAGNGRYDRGVDRTPTMRKGGCMLDHADHGHWHFDAMARYMLTRPGEQSPLVGSDKVSFCLRDNRETPSASPIELPKHYSDCGRDKVQGITPGWADVYDTDLPDQHLVLPADLPDGPYCLHNEADPLQLLLETDDDDNAAVAAIRIRGDTVTSGPSGSCN